MKRPLVTIVIPIYKPQPDAFEICALQQALKVFASYPFTFITPATLDISWYESFCQALAVRFEKFALDGFDSYNRLLLSTDFYARFRSYTYILIYHLDAFVFRDELRYWCQQGYDYIGAAVFHEPYSTFIVRSSRRKLLMYQLGVLKNKYLGNGGFSLRKVSSFYQQTKLFWKQIRQWGNFQEDIFWSYRLPMHNPFFRIPSLAIAEKFATEEANRYMFKEPESPWWLRIPKNTEQSKNEPDSPFRFPENYTSYVPSNFYLPFGCHGWVRWGFSFWKPYIEAQGYTLSMSDSIQQAQCNT